MKNKILLIITAIFLSLQTYCYAVDDEINVKSDLPVSMEEQVEESSEIADEHNLDEDVSNLAQQEDNFNFTNKTAYKIPTSKRKLAKMFLKAMFGVAISSFVLLAILTMYNRMRDGILPKTKTLEGEVSLDMPDDLSSAVKTFLDKTKW